MAETIKEFLISLGFAVDPGSESRFRKSIEGAVKRADTLEQFEKRYGKAALQGAKDFEQAERDRAKAAEETYKRIATSITGLAVATGVAFVKISSDFERFYYISQRTGQTVGDIRALGDAFRRMGLDVQDAVSATESLARNMRVNPGAQGLARSYGLDPGKSNVVDVVDALRARFGRMQYGYATAFAQAQQLVPGVSESAFKAIWDDPEKARREIAASKAARGPNQDENAKAAADLGKEWSDFTRQVESSLENLLTIGIKPATSALHLLTESGLAPFTAALGTLLGVLVGGSMTMGLTRMLFGGGAAAAGAAGVGAGAAAAGGGMLGWMARAFGVGGAAVIGGAAATGHSYQTKEQYDKNPETPAIKKEAEGRVEATKRAYREQGAWGAVKQFFGGGGQQTSTAEPSSGTGEHPILNLITRAEGTSRRGYNDSFAHQIKGTLTDKTLDEIDAAQAGMSGSSAIGKYQFMRGTLGGLRQELGLNGSEKFDEKLQDRLALALYQRRMKQAGRAGGGDEAVLDALAKEWASFPTRNGTGYYPGQRASVSRDDVLKAVREEADAGQRPGSTGLSFGGKPFGSPATNLPDFSRSQLTPPSSNDNTNITINQGDVNTTVHGNADADMLAAGVGRRRRVLDDDLMRSLQGNVR